jgi:Contractile injection system tube protein
MLFDQAKLEKLTIRRFKPATSADVAPQPSDAPTDAYTVQVNPSSYTLNHLVNYSYQRGQGSSAGEAVYTDSAPTNLQFEFLFDGTGVVPKPSVLGDIPLVGAIASALSPDEPFIVMDEIKRFNKFIYYDGEIHRPRYLLLIWGSLVFPSVLTSLTYRFTLFKQDGTPLRAIASCTFCEAIPEAERVRRENASSPDLTHLRDVREGDTLPFLAQEIYGNAHLYLEVARANKLVNFRRLRPATRLSFPPLDRQVAS